MSISANLPMMNSLLVDTNVLIYGLDKSSVYHQSAKYILSQPDLLLFVTSKNISKFFAVTTKLKLPFKLCHEFYEDLKENVTVLFPTDKSLSFFEQLIRQYHPVGNQVHDVEIVSIMLSHGIEQIATFNQKDFIAIKEVKLFHTAH